MNELDLVVLVREVPPHGLLPGAVGTVVEVLDGDRVVVEFCKPTGYLHALATLPTADLLVLVSHARA